MPRNRTWMRFVNCERSTASKRAASVVGGPKSLANSELGENCLIRRSGDLPRLPPKYPGSSQWIDRALVWQKAGLAQSARCRRRISRILVGLPTLMAQTTMIELASGLANNNNRNRVFSGAHFVYRSTFSRYQTCLVQKNEGRLAENQTRGSVSVNSSLEKCLQAMCLLV